MKNVDVEELIERALGYDDDALLATSELIALGLPAARRAIDILNGPEPPYSAANLCRVITGVRDREMIPLLLPLLDSSNFDLARAAFEALGISRDPRARSPLLERVAGSEYSQSNRSLAAGALGEFGDVSAIQILNGIVGEAMEDMSYSLAIAAAGAMAKLGDHRGLPAVIELATMPDDPIFHYPASEALEILVGPGLLAALKIVMLDGDTETRLHGINALRYLGTPEAVDALIALVDDDNYTASAQARSHIRAISGEEFDDDADSATISEWWSANRDSFMDGTCYRFGRPLWVPDIIEEMREPNRRSWTVLELRVITGVDFARDLVTSVMDHDELLDTMRSWWESYGVGRFLAGRLYKYGFEQSLANL